MIELVNLPPELLLRVSSFLTTPEFGHLRRVCKSVEASLFDQFQREFFIKRQFNTEHVSLKTLVDIANHPTFSKSMKEVIIGLDLFTPDPDYGPVSRRYHAAGYVSAVTLLHTGQTHAMLVEAFSKLPNLKTVGLRDYFGAGRFRDGPKASWRSYGWTWSQHPHSMNRTAMNPSDFLPALLSAIGNANARPESIEVFLRGHHRLSPLSFEVFNDLHAPTVLPVLGALQSLMLAVSLPDDKTSSGGYSYGLPGSRYVEDDDVISDPLKRLLHHTPKLKALRLNFKEHQYFAYRFLEWLARPGLPPATSRIVDLKTPAPLPTVTLTHLTSLELGMLTIAPSILLKLLVKFSLSNVSLWKVKFEARHEDCCEHPNFWSQFLAKLSDSMSDSNSVARILIGFPSEVYHGKESWDMRTKYVKFLPEEAIGTGKGVFVEPRVSFDARYDKCVKDWLSNISGRAIAKEGWRPLPDGSEVSEDGFMEPASFDEIDEETDETDDADELLDELDEDDLSETSLD